MDSQPPQDLAEPHEPSRPTPRLSVLVFEPSEAEAGVLLAALDRQTLDPDAFEVRVVGSTPPTAQIGSCTRHEPLTGRPYDVEVVRGTDAELAGLKALELCRAPVCLVLAAGGQPGPELLAGHLLAHESEAGLERVVVGGVRLDDSTGPVDQLLFDDNPLLALPGRERIQLDDGERFCAANVSLPTDLLRSVGGPGRGWRSARGADLDLARRLVDAGCELEVRDELILPVRPDMDVEAWLIRLVDLGRDLAVLFRAEGDLSVLGRTNEVRDEPLWRPFQIAYESMRGRVSEAVSMLEAIRAEEGGRGLPQEVLERLSGLVRSLAGCAVSRGLLWGLRGRDPSRVFTSGAERGPLTSLIIPSYNALDRTRECLQAVRRHREVGFPLDIIVVDNGSTDGSREWLAEQTDVRLIQNDENLGAPRARNQALTQARGEWVVFMDNDVVVTPNWLSRLRRHAEVDPFAACVGPVCNRAAHGQEVPFSGDDPDTRAAEIARDHDGGFRMGLLLSSFCLLVRRDVIDIVGGFDESFSPWGFEDDDFTLRCGLAGFHNRVALDTFVQHKHYGGAKAERHETLLKENWERFAAKWRLTGERGDYSGLAVHLERVWTADELAVPLPRTDEHRGAAVA